MSCRDSIRYVAHLLGGAIILVLVHITMDPPSAMNEHEVKISDIRSAAC
jgi:hypothetical protein